MHPVLILSEKPMAFYTLSCIYGVNTAISDFYFPVAIADGLKLSSVGFCFCEISKK